MLQTPPPGIASPVPIIRLQPSGRWRFVDLSELWHYRELIYFLTWRDIKVRYKQTSIGVAWAVLQPIAMMLVFTLFFGKLAKLPSEGVPYPLFTFCALLPWQVFSRSVSDSANSLVTDQRLISRVYFPRIIVPTASIVGSLVDFGISFLLFLLIMAWYGFLPTANIIFLPFFLLLMMTTALGVGYWLSALNIEYRDVIYALPFISQIWMFLSPVVYPSSLVPAKWRLLYGLNPMAGVIDGFRWSLLGVGPGPSPLLLASTCISLALFTTGIFWFRSRERTFADTIGSGGR